MPTRTEVIQALRARDVYRTEDLALMLDYLEQESGGSNPTLRANLEGDLHNHDVISPKGLERIYDYVQDLGAAALTKREFLGGVLSRDNLSRRLVNYILDLVDGGDWTFPLAAKCTHWWDATDISSLYSTHDIDVTQTFIATPGNVITADGQVVSLAQDKGYPISSRIDLHTTETLGQFYDTDLIALGTLTGNGFRNAVGTSQAGGSLREPLLDDLPMSYACVFRIVDNTTSAFLMAFDGTRLGFILLGGSQQIRFDNPITDTTIPTVVANNTTYAIFGTVRADNTFEAWANWHAGSVSGSGVPSASSGGDWAFGASDRSGNFDLVGGVAEGMLWRGFDETDSRLADFQAYTAAKYSIVWA